MTCGIYKIENNINHKVYIGQSRNIERRWQRHKIADGDYTIHKALQKYGIENFTFSILEECDVNDLDEREIYWIEYFDSYHKGYNQTMGGQGASGRTVKLTEEQVVMIRKILATTDRNNTDIANEFNVSENTVSGINTGYYWKDSLIDYPIRKPLITNHSSSTSQIQCARCGKILKNYGSTYCSECAAFMRRKVERPSKEALLKELQESQGAFTSIGKKYGVTDNTIRRWCASYGLPTHTSDYKIVKEKKGRNLPSVRVQQIDKKTGEVIREFESLSQAQKETGIEHITQASDPNNTSRKSAGGYIWRRV